MHYWLMKSEPGTYSIDDLAEEGVGGWDGVRNYQARNFLRQMQTGDQVLFYHSNSRPSGVAGLAEVVRGHYPDASALDPESSQFDARSTRDNNRWSMVDVRFVKKAKRIIPLQELKRTPGLEGMVLFRNSRLSVQPLTPEEWRVIMDLKDVWQSC